MSGLWEQALSEVAKLSADERNSVGAIILAELADEEAWDRKFAASQDALAKLAQKARADVAAGRAADMDVDQL
jgi:arginine utilization protein RocB